MPELTRPQKAAIDRIMHALGELQCIGMEEPLQGTVADDLHGFRLQVLEQIGYHDVRETLGDHDDAWELVKDLRALRVAGLL